MMFEKKVKLQPLCLSPYVDNVYIPSNLRSIKTVTKKEFLQKYSDCPRQIMISFDKDGKSNPQLITAYSSGMNCWYIVV